MACDKRRGGERNCTLEWVSIEDVADDGKAKIVDYNNNHPLKDRTDLCTWKGGGFLLQKSCSLFAYSIVKFLIGFIIRNILVK